MSTLHSDENGGNDSSYHRIAYYRPAAAPHSACVNSTTRFHSSDFTDEETKMEAKSRATGQ